MLRRRHRLEVGIPLRWESDMCKHLLKIRIESTGRLCTIGSSTPRPSDDDTNHDGSDGIYPPLQFSTSYTGKYTKGVDEQVVPMILPQHTDL